MKEAEYNIYNEIRKAHDAVITKALLGEQATPMQANPVPKAVVQEAPKVVKPDPYVKYGTHQILNPETIKFVERDDFMQKLCMEGQLPAPELEDIIRQNARVAPFHDSHIQHLSQYYIYLRTKNARLPKFGKWATGMFRDDENLAKVLAAAGKVVDRGAIIKISTSLHDILRCAATRHLYSCFAVAGGYEHMPKLIAETAPGIAIAYLDDGATDPPQMRGRAWLHHCQNVKTGEDCVLVSASYGGTLAGRDVVKLLRDMGVKAYDSRSMDADPRAPKNVTLKWINCFQQDCHHDVHAVNGRTFTVDEGI